MDDTIFAQATPPGRSGVAVIRISGPRAQAAAVCLAETSGSDRTAVLRWLRDPESGARIDQALVLPFHAPASFTGEDVVELHVHGSPAVLRSLLTVLGRFDGLRPARPGEFTRRALLNGRLDLAQVEGLGDLLAAETAAQQRQALDAIGGSLSRQVAGWHDALIGALAHVEATIDFADEELPEHLLVAVTATLAEVADGMRGEIAGSGIAERIRDGFEVALIGRPNVGKSTLLNALAGREAALTSAFAGTTRDVLEVRIDLRGLPVTLLDTAGVRDTGDHVESLGVSRARTRAISADLRVFLVDDPADAGTLGVPILAGDLVAHAKADLRPPGADLSVSGLTREGIDDLLDRIAATLAARAARATTAAHARQRTAIEQAVTSVDAARTELASANPGPEFVAEHLRAALRALDFLTGRVDVEAVLDAIFQSFCLGK